MSRRGDNIRKRQDGRWEGRYVYSRNPNGKAVYRSVYGKTYADVKEKLVLCIKENRVNIGNNFDTVNDTAERWLKDVKMYRKHATYVKYEYIYINHIKQHIGNKKICDITPDDCIELLNTEYNKGSNLKGNLSDSIIYSIRNVLTQIIRYGIKDYTFKISDNLKCRNKNNYKTIQIFS